MTFDSTPTPPPPVQTPTWATGADRVRLDRFILGEEIGRGGMGKVHRAWDPMLRRVVALKILLRDDPLQMMHFLREAQIQARVEHPNVCKVYEVGTFGDQPYIAMQYIEGETLARLRTALEAPEIVRIMAQVAAAVHAAHCQGLIHRDIKPGNILLEPQDEGHYKPYILDFGLARDLSNQDLNMSWGLVGTPAYMAPEQARGEAIGPTADVYALGATLYSALTGIPPRDVKNLHELMEAHAEDVGRLRRNPNVSRDLESVVFKCLEFDAPKRYPNAFLLEEDLRRWMVGEPVQAKVAGPMGRVISRIRREECDVKYGRSVEHAVHSLEIVSSPLARSANCVAHDSVVSMLG